MITALTDARNEPSKQAQLLDLAKKRQQTTWEGYRNVGFYHQGRYDCDFVSPYTKAANNVASPIFIMLQDWASDTFLDGAFCDVTCQFGRTPTRQTNKQLDRLVSEYFGVSISETYTSNLFPFIKPKDMSAAIPTRDLVRAANEFALPQIRILAPRLVIALGLNCFNSIRRTQELKPSRLTAYAIADPITVYGSRVWCQAHTSQRGQNNRGGPKQVSIDWQAMSDWFHRGP